MEFVNKCYLLVKLLLSFKRIKLKYFIIKHYCLQSQMTTKSCRHLSHHKGFRTPTIKLVAV